MPSLPPAHAAGHSRPEPLPEAVREPQTPIAADTVFDEAKSYRVRLSGITDYLGTKLSPMHVHIVTGRVATAIRAQIALFDKA